MIQSICVFICNLGIQQDRNTDDLRSCAFVYISIHKERLILDSSAEGKWYGRIVNKTETILIFHASMNSDVREQKTKGSARQGEKEGEREKRREGEGKRKERSGQRKFSV